MGVQIPNRSKSCLPLIRRLDSSYLVCTIRSVLSSSVFAVSDILSNAFISCTCCFRRVGVNKGAHESTASSASWGGGGGDARGVVISCWDDGDEDVEDDKEQDRGGVVKFKLAVFLVRGGGFGNKRIFIESFLIDVEVDKFAANTAEEQVDESDESD